MDELEERRQLDALIAEQDKDDTDRVVPEHRDTISLDAASDYIGKELDGEVITFFPRQRGSVLIGTASYHGTPAGYTNHGCRCARCHSAKMEQQREYRRKKRAEA